MSLKFYEFIGRKLRPVELALLLKFILRIKRKVVTLNDSRKYLIDPISDLGLHLMQNSTYDTDMSEMVSSILSNGDCFVDLGSNEGYFTVMAGQKCGPEGKVFAIEPQVRLWDVILKNCILNGLKNVTIIPFGIGSKNQRLTLQLSPSVNSGSSSFTSRFHLKISFAWLRKKIYGEQDVHIIMLDDLAETFPQKVKLIKIDIEGFEYEALKGASKLLSRKVFDSLLVEIHPATLEGMKQSEQDIDKLLESCGYTKRKINNYLNYYFFEDQ